jgi:hypothetical protein
VAWRGVAWRGVAWRGVAWRAPQLSISQKTLGTLPENDDVMPKHVGATIHNKLNEELVCLFVFHTFFNGDFNF